MTTYKIQPRFSYKILWGIRIFILQGKDTTQSHALLQ